MGLQEPLQSETTMLEHGGIVMDLLKRQVSREDVALALLPREFRILEELMREDGKAVTKTMLLALCETEQASLLLPVEWHRPF